MSRDKIIKALECCTDKNYHCEDCPYFYKSEGIKSSMEILMTDALALIKELTEENERLKSEVSVKRKLLDKAEVRIECVEEENNQLKADICNAEMNLWHITEDNQAKDETIANLIETIKTIQADTVRKMQERLETKAIPMPMYSHLKIVYTSDIDRIVKEMLGEKNET